MTTAQPQPGQTITLRSSGDLSATQYRFADLDSSNEVVNASAGGRVIGVRTNIPGAQGRAADITMTGSEFVELGGTVTTGPVKSDSVGRAVAASADDVAAGIARGMYLGGGTASGSLATILLLPGPTIVRVSGMETLTGAGAISLQTEVTDWVATTDNATLADGLYVGQIKTVRTITGSTGSNILTPATVSADATGGTSPASLTYTAVGQSSTWRWQSDGWKLIRIEQAGTADVAGAATVNPLIAENREAISGTEVITLPAGYYVGQEFYVEVISAAATPVLDVAGLFYDEDSSADGTNVTFDAAAVGNRMRCRWNGARWSVLSHTNAVIEV